MRRCVTSRTQKDEPRRVRRLRAPCESPRCGSRDLATQWSAESCTHVALQRLELLGSIPMRIAQCALASSGGSVGQMRRSGGAQIPASPNTRCEWCIVRRELLRPIRRRGTHFGINPRDFLLRAPLYLAANIELTHTLRNTMQANTSSYRLAPHSFCSKHRAWS